jgi:acyl-CoA synthetase (AMP-forming)/AMP-acid ligase II
LPAQNTVLSLLSAERLSEHYRSGFWRHDTIYSLVAQHARRSPDHFALRDGARRVTYRQLLEEADALAGDLARRGVRPGQRVSVWLPSRIETAVALIACSRNGYVCCPSLHREYTVAEVLALLTRTRSAVFLAEPGYGADGDQRNIFSAARELPFLHHVYCLEAGDALTHQAPTLPLPSERGREWEGAGGASLGRDPDRVVYLAFTSGTTGVPKGVMHSDNTLLANARAVAADWRLGADTVIYTLSPLSHNLGIGALVTAIAVGGELVVHDLPRGRSLLDRLVETRATYLVGVPTHAVDLLAELRARGSAGELRVKGFRISGAPVSGQVIAELMAYGIVPQSGYGMTETCSHQYTLPDDDPRLIIETAGRCCPGFEIRIWREDNPDTEAALGGIGQIGSRGASLMLGYFDDQIATEEAFNRHGWFMTGDLGRLDANGYLRVCGRLKDVIIRGGKKIYPAPIEALALRHPAIERAAAFPVADPRLGEKVCLAVVFRGGMPGEGEAILEHLKTAGLSRFDMPEYLLALDHLKLTATGKVVKRDLVDGVREGRFHPVPVRRRGEG